MRIPLILTACALLTSCGGEAAQSVYGAGTWRFSDETVISNVCSEADHTRTMAGEHGDDTAEGGTLIARCTASKLSSGALRFNLVLDNGATSKDSIDIRDLRISADAAASTTAVETVPTQCESILFHVDGARYEAACTTSAPAEGECQLIGALFDPAVSGISVEFACHAVASTGGHSICEVGGAGGSNAFVSFEECSGL
jgi:hypothetical protein